MKKITSFLALALLVSVAGSAFAHSKDDGRWRPVWGDQETDEITWDSEDGLKIIGAGTLAGTCAGALNGMLVNFVLKQFDRSEKTYRYMAQWGAAMGALAGGLFGGRKGIERANKMGSCDCGVKRACAKGFKYGTCCSALYSNYLCGMYELFGFCALVIGFTHRSDVMRLRHLVTKTILTEDQMYDLLDVCDDLGISVDEARQLCNFIEGRGCPSVCNDDVLRCRQIYPPIKCPTECPPADCCPKKKDEYMSPCDTNCRRVNRMQSSL